MTSRSAVECSATELYPRTDKVLAIKVGNFYEMYLYHLFTVSIKTTGVMRVAFCHQIKQQQSNQHARDSSVGRAEDCSDTINRNP